MENNGGVITGIEPQKKNRKRFSIFVDGVFACGVDREVLLDHPVHEGDRITGDRIAFLEREDTAVRARTDALSLISYRMRSVRELQDRLQQKKYSPELIDRTVGRLLQVGLLDDRKFADAFVHSRLIQRPAARRVLEQELRGKGISPGIAADALAEQYPEEKEAVIARDLAARKSRQLRGDPVKAAKRLADYLLRRGFGWDLIRPLLDEFITGELQD
ncbi:regulatory protein RecX [bacterium]|nr:regulatory protein RecX [bacterium]